MVSSLCSSSAFLLKSSSVTCPAIQTSFYVWFSIFQSLSCLRGLVPNSGWVAGLFCLPGACLNSMRLLESGAFSSNCKKIRIAVNHLQLKTDDSYDNRANNKCRNLLIAHCTSFRSLCVTTLRSGFGKPYFWSVTYVLLKMDYGFLSWLSSPC